MQPWLRLFKQFCINSYIARLESTQHVFRFEAVERTEDNIFGVSIKHRRFCQDTAMILEEVDPKSYPGTLTPFGRDLGIEPQQHLVDWEGERIYILKSYPSGNPTPLPFVKGAAAKFKETFNYVTQHKFFRGDHQKIDDWIRWQETYPQTDDIAEHLRVTSSVVPSPLLLWITGKLT